MLVNTIEHHGNRLYGFMRLRSKMLSGWWSGVDTPKTVMTTRAPAVLKSATVKKCTFSLSICTCMYHCNLRSRQNPTKSILLRLELLTNQAVWWKPFGENHLKFPFWLFEQNIHPVHLRRAGCVLEPDKHGYYDSEKCVHDFIRVKQLYIAP